MVCFFVWSEMYTQVGGCEVSEVAHKLLSAWSGEGCGLQCQVTKLFPVPPCCPEKLFPGAAQSHLATSGRIDKVELSH